MERLISLNTPTLNSQRHRSRTCLSLHFSPGALWAEPLHANRTHEGEQSKWSFYVVGPSIVFMYTAAGVAFYCGVAHMRFIDALYFVVVTLTTVGYGDLKNEGDFVKVGDND